MKDKLNLVDVIRFSLVFALFVIVGTVSHELGHLAVVKSYGYLGTLHYGSCSWKDEEVFNKQRRLLETHGNLREMSIEQRTEYMNLTRNRNLKHDFWITVGGPVQTIMVGTLGWLILYWRKRTWTRNGFKFLDWLLVYLALFWSREPFNLAGSI